MLDNEKTRMINRKAKKKKETKSRSKIITGECGVIDKILEKEAP